MEFWGGEQRSWHPRPVDRVKGGWGRRWHFLVWARRSRAERGTGRWPAAFEHARAHSRGEKREEGGSKGEDATRRRVGVRPGLDQRAAPDRVGTDRGPTTVRVGGALCFEQERAAPCC
jgi:hypothetical protein